MPRTRDPRYALRIARRPAPLANAAAPPSLRDVAERAGVAVSSASRALSGGRSVSPELRAKVDNAARALGYEPNLLARGLRKGNTLAVGFIVRDISNSLLSEIALGAEMALRERGYSMLLANSEGSPDLDTRHLRLFRQRNLDGVLVSLAGEQHGPTLDELELLRAPVVLIDREVPRPSGLSAVMCDHAGGMAAACDWLAARGHRRIGLVSGPLALRPGRECASALHASAQRIGFTAATAAGAFDAEHGRNGAGSLLRLPAPPTALIAGSRQILPGLLDAVRDAPEIDVVTFDCDALLTSVARPIAVIDRQPEEVGRTAAELLLARFDDRPAEQRVVPSLFRPPS